jgi:hypothetical protein
MIDTAAHLPPAAGVPVVARGRRHRAVGRCDAACAGRGAVAGPVQQDFARRPRARTAVVQPGVRNLAVSEAAAPHGSITRPIPSSQIACTLGGNVAENSGGVHCLKYGLTVHNVLRVRVVSIEGEVVEIRQRGAGCAGLRPAGAADRFRGHARRGHRGDGQAGAQAGTGAGGDGLLRRRGQGRRRGGRDHRRRHHSGRAGDDGQAGDGRRRALRQGRLRPERRGHPALRVGRHAGRGRRGNRA